ncbi:hypothetical protein [Flavobacterium sp.]|uniref:hypothetical protein n=1 Tax=Flavobacterium sp. TaxID=239 RepID=UPI0025D8A02A|nr:hypothetical protein [Flavobacterium sp.]
MCEIETAKDFLKDIISALIGTGTALLIFYLTIQSEIKKEKKKSKDEDSNRVRHFSNLIKSSIGHIEKITSNLDEMVSNYEKNNLEFQLLRFSPNKSLNRLEKLLKNENYFLSYINIFGESKIKTFNNISSEVDYFNMQIDQLWTMVEKSQHFDYERKTKFKFQVNDLMNLTAWFTKQPNLLEYADIEKLNSYIKDFYDNIQDETDLNYFYEFIRKVLENVLIKYTNNQLILEHLPKFRDTSVLFREIKMQNDNHKEDLKQISKTLKHSLQSYKSDASELIK